MNVTIRPYKPSDLDACRALWRELTQRHRNIYGDPTIGGDDPGTAFDTHMKDPRLACIWVAEHDGAVVGFCGLLVDGEVGEVEPIVVRSAERSKGIGRQLLARMISEAKEHNLSSLSIRPVARNIEAIALFHEVGFQLLGHLDMFMELRNEREWKTAITVHGREFRF